MATPLDSDKQDYLLETEPGKFKITLGDVTVWKTFHFAHCWYEDSINEARDGKDHNARRREIIFAVCFAETYLAEWVREYVLKSQWDLFSKYFPVNDKRGIRDRWKEIPKKLKSDGHITHIPDLSGTEWMEFDCLVKFRDGLVHANSSRPETNVPKEQEKENPFPSKGDLDSLCQGWPTRTVITLIKNLHSSTQTPIPDWLKEP